MIINKLKYLLALLFVSFSTLASIAQEYERREIKILDFKQVSNFHIDYAKEFAYQESNRDSTIWALLIVETNDPNIRVISSESNPGHYVWEELRKNPRFDINEHRMPGEIWYSLRPGAKQFRVAHSLYRHDTDIPALYNREGKHIGRLISNWYIPPSKMLGEYGLVEAGKTYRLKIEVPQYHPIIAPIAPENLVVTNSRKTLTPKWAPEVTEEQKRILTELIESMVFVDEGSFMMGAKKKIKDEDCYDKEVYTWDFPIHRVALSSYYICKFEVTQEQWQAVMDYNPSYNKGDKKPVESVSWNDCQEFIQELNKLTGLIFSLPTEAQWEYAARGGNKSRGYKYSGGNDLYSVGWFGHLNTYGDKKGNSNGKTQQVGQKDPNELGLYDMSGNVWELCHDAWYRYDDKFRKNPVCNGNSKANRVMRGACFGNEKKDCYITLRNFISPGRSSNGLGFRLVINPD